MKFPPEMRDKYQHNSGENFMHKTVETISGIYRITNNLNGDFYIGSSVDISKRWCVHKYTASLDSQPYRSFLYPEIRLHGIENFTFEVLELVEPDRNLLFEREQHYMDILLPAYNIRPAIPSALGTTHSDEWKAEASVRQTAYLLAHREENRARREGKKWDELFGPERSAEIRSRMSEKRKLNPVACAAWNKGQISPERLQLLLDKRARKEAAIKLRLQKAAEKESRRSQPRTSWNKGIKTGPPNAETRALISQNRKGKQIGPRGPRSDETKQRVSDAQKGVPRLYARGKVGPNSKNGHHGISWRKDTQKWQVRLPSEQSPDQDRKFGSYDDLDEALSRRDNILAMGVDNAVANDENAGRKVMIDPAVVRNLLDSGTKPVTIQRELGLSKPGYYRLLHATPPSAPSKQISLDKYLRI